MINQFERAYKIALKAISEYNCIVAYTLTEDGNIRAAINDASRINRMPTHIEGVKIEYHVVE